MLDAFIDAHQEELIALARKKVAGRRAPASTETELRVGVPLFLKQLTAILRSSPRAQGASKDPQVGAAAKIHGRELLRMGLTVGQVVHAYGDVCQAITQLAMESRVALSTEEFRTLNGCLDDAIAAAVGEYVHQHDEGRKASQAQAEVGRLGEFAHELRNLVNTGLLSLDVLRSGAVGISGSTGAVLGRTLNGLRDLVDRSLSEVRLASGTRYQSHFRAAEFVEEVEIAAALDARSRGGQLVVDRVNFEWFIDGDRQLLASAMANLLQNALKFTKAGGRVSLRTKATASRIVFEVEDECGGLPSEKIARLFKPFEQATPDKSGLGLGLTISRRAVEANGGKLTATDVPGRGCIFALELPLAAPEHPAA